MKYLLTLFLILGISFSMSADDQDVEHTHENDYEDGCVNDIDDDMDGDVDGNDDDCVVVIDDSGDGFLAGDISAYLVWGVGVALLSSDLGSDSGTATTN